MKAHYYKWEDFTTSTWSGGKTTELFILPSGASYKERTFIARLSSATIEVPFSKFTHLDGIERFITPITYPFLIESGKIQSNNSNPTLLSTFDVYHFNGEDQTISYGMTRDFNLMLNKKEATGWMKTSKEEKQTTFNIDDKKKSYVFIFNPFMPSNAKVNDTLHKMESDSLLIFEDINEKEIKIEPTNILIYGLINIK